MAAPDPGFVAFLAARTFTHDEYLALDPNPRAALAAAYQPAVTGIATPVKKLLHALAPGVSLSPSGLSFAVDAAVLNLTTQAQRLSILETKVERVAILETKLEQEEVALAILETKLEQEEVARARIEARARYTTQNEHDIGNTILKDLDNNRLTTFELIVRPVETATMDTSLLDRMGDIQGKEEDMEVNAPLHRLIQSILPVGFQAKLTINACKLVDNEGREQREDILILQGSALDELWVDLVTMVVGKLRLDTKGWKIALGQAQRRANAILDCQPWRKEVIIIISDKSQVAYLRLDSLTRVPSVISPVALFPEGVAAPAAGVLRAMLLEPSLFGFVKCPISLDTSSYQRQPVQSSKPIFARLEGDRRRAVFLVNFSAGQSVVVKASIDKSAIKQELACLHKLRNVPGVLHLKSAKILDVLVTFGGSQHKWFALSLTPYCSRLHPTVASQPLFAGYATALHSAHKLGLCHNDISPQNLLVEEKKGGEPLGLVADWGIASKPGDVVTATTVLFAPSKRLLGEDYAASPLADFESLFYVAICCAAQEVPWQRAFRAQPGNIGHMERFRALYRVKKKEWKWLTKVREALEGGNPAKVFNAFTKV